MSQHEPPKPPKPPSQLRPDNDDNYFKNLGLNRHLEDFKNFINNHSIPRNINKLTDNEYELIVQPLDEWLTKRSILEDNSNLIIHIYENKGTQRELIVSIINKNRGHKLILPKTLKNVELSIVKVNAQGDIIVQNIDSLRITNNTIGKLIEDISLGYIDLPGKEFRRFIHKIIDILEDLLQRTKSSLTPIDIGETKSSWNKLRFRWIDTLVEEYLKLINKEEQYKSQEHILNVLIAQIDFDFDDVMYANTQEEFNEHKEIIIKRITSIIKTLLEITETTKLEET